ncbi:MAG: prenyltransferase/squalene oxidase repeat-containing protein [Planctomycetota bacterium]
MKWLLPLVALILMVTSLPQARSEDVPQDYRETVRKGLDWLARQQERDGHLDATGGQYPITMTALGGMAYLMEGSTLREGKYRDNIRRAVDFLMSRAQKGGTNDGMIGNPNIPGESGRYMYGHGFSMLFLATVYGDEEDNDRRRRLEDLLARAAKFSFNAQTVREINRGGKSVKFGGWGYVSAKEGSNFDEGSVTITQVQALRAVRNAGIEVPPEAIQRAVVYLEECTNAEGGIIYQYGGGGGGDGRPALTAAAIACGISAGDYFKEPSIQFVKKWFQFCQKRLGTLGGNRTGHDEYTHYYFAQAVYMLGDDGYKKLFPGAKESDTLTWTKYRKETFDNLVRTQGADGSWTGGHVGPVFITSVHVCIMQLDKACLPIYQR